VTSAITVELPRGLCQLAGAPNTISVTVQEPATQRKILDEVERQYPMLTGTIRDHSSGLRRPFLRFFVAEQDLSHLRPDDPLPTVLNHGKESFLIIGAIAGG
jgi:molybdopterin synthase sulfur carrier subunit